MKEHYLKTELYDLVKSDSIIFDFLQNGSLDGIWYWDIDNPEHEWMSPKFWELFGYDPKLKKHLASEWQDMIFKEDLDVALDNFEKHYENPKHPYDQIVRYKHKDGSTVWVRCRGIMIRDDEGKPIRMLGAHTDITELKEISSKLEKANESLINMELSIRNQQKLEAIGTMASGVAHEINNPINGILNYGQIILDEEIVNDNIKGYAREIIGESKRIAQIVSSLLDFSRHN